MIVDPQDDLALAHAIAHRRTKRTILRAEKRIHAGAAAGKPKPKPPSAEKCEAILAAVTAAFPPHDRPNLRDISKAARVSPNEALEARRILAAGGRWPYSDASAIAGRVERSITLQEPSVNR